MEVQLFSFSFPLLCSYWVDLLNSNQRRLRRKYNQPCYENANASYNHPYCDQSLEFMSLISTFNNDNDIEKQSWNLRKFLLQCVLLKSTPSRGGGGVN